MSDAALREVLRSPLDDGPERGPKRWAEVVALVAAAACGFGAAAGARALLGPNDTAPTTTTTATTSTTIPGPVAVGEVLVEVPAAWRSDGRLYLVVATTARPGADPGEVVGMRSAHWVLRPAAGQLLVATGEMTTPLAPGAFTVEFPDADLSGGADLLVYPTAQVQEEAFRVSLASAQLPWEGPLPGAPFRIGEEHIEVDRFRLDDAGGEFVWHLAGDSVARAQVNAGATYAEVGGREQAIVAEPDLPYGFLWAIAGGRPATRSDTIHLFHLDDAQQPSFRSRFWGDPERVVPVEGLTFEVTVALYRYAPEPIVVPLSLTVGQEG